MKASDFAVQAHEGKLFLTVSDRLHELSKDDAEQAVRRLQVGLYELHRQDHARRVQDLMDAGASEKEAETSVLLDLPLAKLRELGGV